MNTTQVKINNASKKIAFILKIGGMLTIIASVLAVIAICILTFSNQKTKMSFISAFDITANNGTILNAAPQSLMIMFTFMLVNTIMMTIIIYVVHSIFKEIEINHTPFYEKNTSRIKFIAAMAVTLSLVGSFSDALADFYTIGQMTWKIDIAGIVLGFIIYCIALAFQYGYELQQQSDETL